MATCEVIEMSARRHYESAYALVRLPKRTSIVLVTLLRPDTGKPQGRKRCISWFRSYRDVENCYKDLGVCLFHLEKRLRTRKPESRRALRLDLWQRRGLLEALRIVSALRSAQTAS